MSHPHTRNFRDITVTLAPRHRQHCHINSQLSSQQRCNLKREDKVVRHTELRSLDRGMGSNLTDCHVNHSTKTWKPEMMEGGSQDHRWHKCLCNQLVRSRTVRTVKSRSFQKHTHTHTYACQTLTHTRTHATHTHTHHTSSFKKH